MKPVSASAHTMTPEARNIIGIALANLAEENIPHDVASACRKLCELITSEFVAITVFVAGDIHDGAIVR